MSTDVSVSAGELDPSFSEPWGEERVFPLYKVVFSVLLLAGGAWFAHRWVAVAPASTPDPEPKTPSAAQVLRLGDVPLSLDEAPVAARRRTKRGRRRPSIARRIENLTAHRIDASGLAATDQESAALQTRDRSDAGGSIGAEIGRIRVRGAEAGRQRQVDFLSAGPRGRGGQGRMAQSAARRGLDGLEPAVRRCHQIKPTLAGRLSYAIEVDDRGQVTDIVEGDDSTLGKTRVAHCVARAIERIRLPAEPGRPIVLLEYAWDLR